jgi:hypothetical protein
VRVYDQPFLGVFPRDRAMSPNGHLYFPGTLWLDDFAAPGIALSKRALFIHEGTHLYQWYGLGQMGMIAQHYYTLKEGGRIPRAYGDRCTLADYQKILPVRDW